MSPLPPADPGGAADDHADLGHLAGDRLLVNEIAPRVLDIRWLNPLPHQAIREQAAAIGAVLVDFVPLSKLMGESMTALHTWAKGRARPATTSPNSRPWYLPMCVSRARPLQSPTA